jgi:hypothetical protein
VHPIPAIAACERGNVEFSPTVSSFLDAAR